MLKVSLCAAKVSRGISIWKSPIYNFTANSNYHPLNNSTKSFLFIVSLRSALCYRGQFSEHIHILHRISLLGVFKCFCCSCWVVDIVVVCCKGSLHTSLRFIYFCFVDKFSQVPVQNGLLNRQKIPYISLAIFWIFAIWLRSCKLGECEVSSIWIYFQEHICPHIEIDYLHTIQSSKTFGGLCSPQRI